MRAPSRNAPSPRSEDGHAAQTREVDRGERVACGRVGRTRGAGLGVAKKGGTSWFSTHAQKSKSNVVAGGKSSPMSGAAVRLLPEWPKRIPDLEHRCRSLDLADYLFADGRQGQPLAD